MRKWERKTSLGFLDFRFGFWFVTWMADSGVLGLVGLGHGLMIGSTRGCSLDYFSLGYGRGNRES